MLFKKTVWGFYIWMRILQVFHMQYVAILNDLSSPNW